MTNFEFGKLFDEKVFYKTEKKIFKYDVRSKCFKLIGYKDSELERYFNENPEFIKIKKSGDSFIFIHKASLNEYIDKRMANKKYSLENHFIIFPLTNLIEGKDEISFDADLTSSCRRIRVSKENLLNSIDDAELREKTEKFLLVEKVKAYQEYIEIMKDEISHKKTWFKPEQLSGLEEGYKKFRNELSESEINELKIEGV